MGCREVARGMARVSNGARGSGEEDQEPSEGEWCED